MTSSHVLAAQPSHCSLPRWKIRRDRHTSVVNAARALGLIEDERTVEPLLAARRDDDEDVRVAAIFCVGLLEGYQSSGTVACGAA